MFKMLALIFVVFSSSILKAEPTFVLEVLSRVPEALPFIAPEPFGFQSCSFLGCQMGDIPVFQEKTSLDHDHP